MHAVILATIAPLLMSAEAAGAGAGPGPTVFDRFFPLTMLLLIALVIPTALLGLNYLISRFLAHGMRNTNPARDLPYESGLPSTLGSAGERFDIKFYLIAMLFLAFDIEVAFLYPWVIHFKHGGWDMVWILVVFLVLLEAGYLYLYKKGALDWDR